MSGGSFWKSEQSVKNSALRCCFILVFMYLILIYCGSYVLLISWKFGQAELNRWHKCPWGKIYFYNNKIFPKVYSYADEDIFCLFLDQAKVEWICLLEEEFVCSKQNQTSTDVRVSLPESQHIILLVGCLWICHCWYFLCPHIQSIKIVTAV